MEILYTLLYSLFIGFYGVFRKLSLRKSGESVVLVMFTTVAFLLSLLFIPLGIIVPFKYVLIFALKGFLLAVSWFLILKVLKDADLSIVAITRNVIAAILSFIVGIFIFNESVSVWQIVGAIIVVLGVTLINIVDKKSSKSVKVIHLIFLLLSALITTTSSVIDKFATASLTSYQVIFWTYMFISIFSWIFFLIECLRKKIFLIEKQDLKNFWIYIVGVFLFVGDCMLFLAYRTPGSQLITITILSKLQAVVAVLASIAIFKEKNILKKILLTLFVIVGVILISIS